MDSTLKNILRLLDEKNISNTKFQKDMGFYSSMVSEWKNGSSKSYEKHLVKIADYLDTSVDFLTGKYSKKEKSPDELTYDDFSYAMYGHSGDLTEEQKQILLNLAKEFVKEKQAEKSKE